MALTNSNVSMQFVDYTIDDGGINLRFLAADPGPGQESYYTILLTDTELAGIANQAALATLVRTKLNRKLRATGIATRLDGFIGQSIVV